MKPITEDEDFYCSTGRHLVKADLFKRRRPNGQCECVNCADAREEALKRIRERRGK